MTKYAQLIDGQMIRDAYAPTQPGYGPDGQWHDYSDPAVVAGYLADGGWVPIVDTPRPDDTATTTWDAGWSVTGGTVTRTWTERPKTADELAAQAAAADRATTRQGIIEQALVRLAADAAEQTQRAATIQAAIDAVDAQIAAVQGYTFAGSTVAGIHASLNTALKPQLVSILTRQRQIGQLLAEMALWRAGTDRDLAWLARYVTST